MCILLIKYTMANYIDTQCNLLQISTNTSKFKLYFYGLIFNDKACMKPGMTEQDLQKRIKQYLLKEHRDKNKDMSTFILIAVYEFESKEKICSIAWKIKFNNIITGKINNKHITNSSKSVIKNINNKSPINMKSLEEMCDDITEKIKVYNKKNNKKVQYNRITAYLRLIE
jgi:hypothetical protein